MPLIISKDEARTMNAQEGSRFFSIPIELRHAIYLNAFQFAERHLRCVTEKDGSRCFRLTPCTEPVMPSADAATNGWERNPSNEWQDPIFQRRLASSWGPHWACEELALNLWYIDQQREENARNLCSALRVCKKMLVISIPPTYKSCVLKASRSAISILSRLRHQRRGSTSRTFEHLQPC